MSFYGESWKVDYANSLAGTAVAGADISYHYDGRSSVAAAGSVIAVGIYPAPLALTSGDAAVISAVVETGPSSSGTLRLSAGLDPNWYATDTSFATDKLGQFPVTGTTTVVAGPITNMTVADLLGNAKEPAILVEVIDGSVEIVQVKLRIWPPSGPSGAWEPADSFQDSSAPLLFTSDQLASGNTPEVTTSPQDAWSAGRTAFDTATTGINLVPDGAQLKFTEGALTSARQNLTIITADPSNPPPGWWAQINYLYSVCVAQLSQVVYSPNSSDVDPREVNGDYQASARAVGGGPLMQEFNGWAPGSKAHIDGPGYVVWQQYTKEWADAIVPDGKGGGGYLGPARRPTGTVTQYSGPTYFDLPAWPYFAMGVLANDYYTYMDGGADTTGGLNSNDPAASTRIQANLTVPAHERFNSALPWVNDTPPPILPVPGQILTPVQDIAVTSGDPTVHFATT